MSYRNLKIIIYFLSLVFISFGQNQNIDDIIEEERQKLNAIQNQDSEYFQEIEKQYRHYEAAVTAEYEQAEQQARQELEEMKKKILEKWDDLELQTNKKFVEYDDNLNSKGSIDFENGQVEIEAIAESNNPNAEEEAKNRIKERMKSLIAKKSDDQKPLLKEQIKNKKDQNVNQENVDKFIKSEVENNIKKQKEYDSRDGKNRVKYTVQVPMVPNHIQVRANRYKEEVIEQADNFDIDPALVMAIIHTESAFNPQAKSYIPAYGLMQLVPRTGARDAYNYLYNRDRFLSSRYLFNPQNNIELGCAYISKLRYVYFKNVNNDDNALYCVISSYNGGVGTVAKTLCGNTNLKSVTRIINTHDPEWTYSTLENRLPAKETRNYLRRVTKRQRMYASWL